MYENPENKPLLIKILVLNIEHTNIYLWNYKTT